MDAQLLAWLSTNLRWFHLVTGAAWIGASFYFNWLNNHVRALGAPESDPAVTGEVFAIHGGAFYRVLKYTGAPRNLPAVLHWFKFEAYFTWITGALLLATTYWMDSAAMMVDPAVHALSPASAAGIGAATLVAGWLVYDLLCRSPLARAPAALAGVGSSLVVAASWALFHLFSARAAAMHLGAMLGTIMAANVFFVIIPGQRRVVDALVGGNPPPLADAAAGSMRSLHNNYLTLPVLLVMVSNHYPNVWAAPGGWWRTVLLCAFGVLIRHGYNRKGQGVARPFLPSWIGAAGLLAMAIVPLLQTPPAPATGPAVSFTTAQMIISARCLPCHSAEPTQSGFVAPPKGLTLQDRASIEANRAKILTQVGSLVMPLGNLTGMTDEERQTLVAWAGQ